MIERCELCTVRGVDLQYKIVGNVGLLVVVTLNELLAYTFFSLLVVMLL